MRIMSSQKVHDLALELLRFCDRYDILVAAARCLHRIAFSDKPTNVGGIRLSYPLILAAGFVKGDGFHLEHFALLAQAKWNIIPGWRIIPALVGPVEFGSFTRYPREGNSGVVIWRDASTKSTRNRVGLKNPGAWAAATFLGRNKNKLPKEFGINVAVSPGIDDVDEQRKELVESLNFFVVSDVLPTWFTLNLSCPNTGDDPLRHQLSSRTRQLCEGCISYLQDKKLDIPLWVKVSPDLTHAQYRELLQVFNEVGVKAVIATNTLQTGVGGGNLFTSALLAAKTLQEEIQRMQYPIDLIGCGGILDGTTYQSYRRLGIKAAQYWSAMVYRGPLAATIIEREKTS